MNHEPLTDRSVDNHLIEVDPFPFAAAVGRDTFKVSAPIADHALTDRIDATSIGDSLVRCVEIGSL